ncbi:Uncharacterized protein dnl_57340 [Desulfonema limicola]|uniref:Uncharacterized protein n=1 Tax=Desulfonema limicola TaxID=45656 RepID=A0A975BDT2_9BACT|nr:Uncharacterized protein dnl_57340 [Desulfonema limicola]
MDKLLEKLVCGLLPLIENNPDSPNQGSLFCKYHNNHHTRGVKQGLLLYLQEYKKRTKG